MFVSIVFYVLLQGHISAVGQPNRLSCTTVTVISDYQYLRNLPTTNTALFVNQVGETFDH